MTAPQGSGRSNPADGAPPMVKPITYASARDLAEAAHRGQVDKAGRPYFEHVFAVGDALAGYGSNTQIAGVLHDILEDTDVTVETLRSFGVPEHVINAVVSVTRRPDEMYMDLIRRAAANPIGRLVKLADNRHNSNEERLALLPRDQAERLRRKYAKAREVLEAAS